MAITTHAKMIGIVPHNDQPATTTAQVPIAATGTSGWPATRRTLATGRTILTRRAAPER